jgi:hypothetical protein
MLPRFPTCGTHTHLLTSQRLQNDALRAQVRELHYTLKLPYVYYYITKLCRLNEEAITNNYDENVGRIEKGEARRRLKIAEAKLTTVQVIKLPL